MAAVVILLLAAPVMLEAGYPEWLVAAAAGSLAIRLIIDHERFISRSSPMARRKSSDYRKEASHELFELELDAIGDDGQPVVLEFADPNRLPAETAFDLADPDIHPREVLEKLLGPYWDAFWREWKVQPVDELNALVEDVMKHYGAEPGKLARSRR